MLIIYADENEAKKTLEELYTSGNDEDEDKMHRNSTMPLPYDRLYLIKSRCKPVVG